MFESHGQLRGGWIEAAMEEILKGLIYSTFTYVGFLVPMLQEVYGGDVLFWTFKNLTTRPETALRAITIHAQIQEKMRMVRPAYG